MEDIKLNKELIAKIKKTLDYQFEKLTKCLEECRTPKEIALVSIALAETSKILIDDFKFNDWEVVHGVEFN